MCEPNHRAIRELPQLFGNDVHRCACFAGPSRHVQEYAPGARTKLLDRAPSSFRLVTEKRVQMPHRARRLCLYWNFLPEERKLEKIEQRGKSLAPKRGIGELLVWF